MNAQTSNSTRYLLRLALGAYLAITLLALAASGGCYDGSALVERVRSQATRNRLDEVDLGVFRTSMPHDPETNGHIEMELHIFGTVPRYRIPAIKKQLETESYRLRHETLTAVREATQEELSEPDLSQLRERISQVVNSILEDAPIKTIGFHDIRIIHE